MLRQRRHRRRRHDHQLRLDEAEEDDEQADADADGPAQIDGDGPRHGFAQPEQDAGQDDRAVEDDEAHRALPPPAAGATWNATKAFSPIPGASAIGTLPPAP